MGENAPVRFKKSATTVTLQGRRYRWSLSRRLDTRPVHLARRCSAGGAAGGQGPSTGPGHRAGNRSVGSRAEHKARLRTAADDDMAIANNRRGQSRRLRYPGCCFPSSNVPRFMLLLKNSRAMKSARRSPAGSLYMARLARTAAGSPRTLTLRLTHHRPCPA